MELQIKDKIGFITTANTSGNDSLKISKNIDKNIDNNNNILKKKEIVSTCCKSLNSVTFEWSVALPSHPIPPFELKAHPLAILIGWVGALPRNLERYTKIYHENGFCTLSFIPPTSGHFFPRKMKQIAISLSDFLLEYIGGTPRSIIIQVFSGNLLLLSHLYELWANDKDKFKILINSVKGQIFDSCPSEISEKTAYSALVTPFPKANLYKKAVGITCRIYGSVVDVPKLNSMFWERLSNCPIQTPQHYFYSLDDPIASYLMVEKGIDTMRKQKISVTSNQFDQSKHCNHLNTHPMQYLNNLYKFWQLSLKSRDPNPIKPSSYQNILNSLGLVSKL